MANPGEPSPSAGHPGPRWGGDGSLGEPGSEADTTVLAAADPPVILASVRSGDGPDRNYASLGRRLASFLVDEAAKTFLWLIIIVTVLPWTGEVASASSDEVDFLALLPRILLSLGYDWIFWTQGWTPGAAVLGLRIIDDTERPPGPRRAAVRVAGSVLSGASFFVGYLWMLRSKRRQTWHDSMAGTFVIREERERGGGRGR
jgi:uncharacterized RDD family membrane protein YckC